MVARVTAVLAAVMRVAMISITIDDGGDCNDGNDVEDREAYLDWFSKGHIGLP